VTVPNRRLRFGNKSTHLYLPETKSEKQDSNSVNPPFTPEEVTESWQTKKTFPTFPMPPR
jgi:hypothetical protein